MNKREIYNEINAQFATTGLPCVSDESIAGHSYCEIAKEHYSGSRVNPKTGEIEAEFTDGKGHKTYLNDKELMEKIKETAQKLKNGGDTLSVTNPEDMAKLEQLLEAGQGMGELAEKISKDNPGAIRNQEASVNRARDAVSQMQAPAPMAP